MTQTSKKEPGADAVVVSTNAIGPAKTAIASVSSTSVSNSGPDGNNKKKNKQIPQVPSSTTASTAGQAGIVAKDLKGGKSTAGSSQANKQKQQKVTAPKKAVANQSNNNGASKQAVARAAPTSATLPYPWVSPPENPAILQALNQLCHGSKRLRSECYPGRPDRRILVGASSRYLAAPDRDPRRPGRAAVVIDCEMVEVAARRDELVRLCALDFVTGEILIDALVEPTARVIDWRTRVSGVSPAIMSAAKASGSGSGSGGVLAGWPAARARLLEYVDAGTVLAGHALHHDLKVLGVAHARVVDSAIVTAEAAFPGGGGSKLKRKWGLRNLARELLGLAIQGSPRGHDSVEDALATREVLLWCAKRPLSLAAWGAAAGAAWEREVRETAERQRRKAREKKEKEEKGKRKAARAAYAGRQVDEDYGYSCIETETVSWEEFLEMAEYPPGYDPSWSD
ncbi:ribonuclease H-like domain-containing protein [Biscogniauxia marginata]|nr:ribonuclease H-like domain-containing protein [Biscogniauxia marginata]